MESKLKLSISNDNLYGFLKAYKLSLEKKTKQYGGKENKTIWLKRKG